MINIVLHTGEGLTTRPSTISCAHNPLAPLHTTTYDFQVKLTDMSLLDMQIRIRQQVVDIGDPARDRIFDRYHRQFGRAVVHSLKHVFKTRARQRLHLGIRSSAGHVRIGTWEALEGDFAVHTDRSVS